MTGKEFTFSFAIGAAFSGSFQRTFGAASGRLTELSQKTITYQQRTLQLQKAMDRGSISAGEYIEKMKLLSMNSRYASEEMKNLQKRIDKQQFHGEKFQEYGGKALAAIGWGMGLMNLAQGAIDFESSMAEVKKVVDFDTPEQFKEMSQDILELSQRIPMSAEGIADIVAAGGQSGIAKNELIGFAETASKMGVAFGISADLAGSMMAQWRTAFKMGQPEVEELADKINYLGNNTAASAPLISDVVTRVGPLGAIGGVASGEIAALGASMVSAGIQSEVAATGVKNLILALVSGESATKTQAAAFGELGLDAVELAQYMQKDAAGGILAVLEGIKRLDKAKQASVLQSIFGKESLTAIGPLLSNLDALRENLKMVGDDKKYKGSMDAEFITMAATTGKQLQILDQNMTALSITAGSVFLPTLNEGVQGLTELTKDVGAFARENPELVKVGAAFLALAGSAYFAYNGIMATYHGYKNVVETIALVRGGVQKLSLAQRVATLWTRSMNLAMTVSSGACRIFTATMSTASGALNLIKTAVSGLWRVLMANPWIAVAALAVGTCYWIYQNWDMVKQWFITLWNDPEAAMHQFIDGVKLRFNDGLNWLAEKWEWLKGILSSPINALLNVEGAENGERTIAANATGGIYGKGAFLTTFAEKSGESAIPHTPTRRNIGLLAKTNAIMGNPLGGGNITATFAPQITVQGGTGDTATQIDTIMAQKMREFEEMLKRIAAQQRRLSYA